MPLPLLPLLVPVVQFILANGARAAVRKYGPQAVKKAIKQIRKRRQAINKEQRHLGPSPRNIPQSQTHILFDAPKKAHDLLNPPELGEPLEFQRGGHVGRRGSYREQPNLPSRGDPIQDAVGHSSWRWRNT